MREFGWPLNPCFQLFRENLHLFADQYGKIDFRGSQRRGQTEMIFIAFVAQLFHRTEHRNFASLELPEFGQRRRHRGRVGVIAFIEQQSLAAANGNFMPRAASRETSEFGQRKPRSSEITPDSFNRSKYS